MFTFPADEVVIRACMITCLVSQGIVLVSEVIKMRNLGHEYFLEFYHYIELFHIGIFTFYFWLRMFFTASMLPNEYVHKVNGNDEIDELKENTALRM